jgi:hypothetical protein
MKTHKDIFSLKILFTGLSIVLCILTQAQSFIDEEFLDKIETNASFMLNETDAVFKSNQTPSKWDKESAVVIGYSRSILFDKQSRGGFMTRREQSLWFLEKNRFKIKLNDKNSVQSFSEIYFRYGHKEDGFIARIIKQDGTIFNVDLKNAVGVENAGDVPEYFKSFFDKVASSGYRYYKTPVPDLEPGDILEYVTNTKSKLNVSASGYIEFSPIYEICSKEYPVIHNEIIIETDDKSFFKSLSLNGAPKFTKQQATENGFFRYVFTDKNRETENDVNFISPLLQYPVVKFQVIYSNNDQAKGALIGEKGELKSGFAIEELAQKAWEDYEKVGDYYLSPDLTVQGLINQCFSELAKLGAKNWTEDMYAQKAYYILRNKIVFRDSYLGDKVFAYIFGSLLFQRDIKSEILISTGNHIGSLKQVLFDEEIRYAIKVGDKLYFNLTDFSNPGELVESLLDNEAYIIYPPAKKSNTPQIKPFKLPGTTASENLAEITIKAQLSENMKNLMVVRTSSYKGLHKAKMISDALKFTPYMLEDYVNYGGESPGQHLKGKQAGDYINAVTTIKTDFSTQKTEYIKRSLQSEFRQPVSNIRFEVVSEGRSLKKNTLVTKEGFELTSFVRKAGDKYLINLAGLMGSQLQIKNEEKEREHDIDVRYPRTLKWSISFKIPEGYTAHGLTEISNSVENEAGSFTIAAKEENGFILLDISKIYKQKTISKDKWKEVMAFLELAYNSSFKYILLKPKQ